MISRTAFCSAQAARMLAARTGPMPSTSRSRSGVVSMMSKTFSPNARTRFLAETAKMWLRHTGRVVISPLNLSLRTFRRRLFAIPARTRTMAVFSISSSRGLEADAANIPSQARREGLLYSSESISEKHNGIQWGRAIMMRNISSGPIIKSKHEVVS